MDKRYIEVGEIIYGAQRLRHALDSVRDWFLVEVEARGIPAIGMTEVAKAADLYCQLAPARRTFYPEFLTAIDAIQLLETQSHSLAGASEVEVKAALRRVKILHFSLADLMQEVGFPGTHSESLRSRGQQIYD